MIWASQGKRGRRLAFEGDRARDSGDWETARLRYRAALDLNPTLIPIWVQYGHALKQQGNWIAAEAAYRTAIERDGKTADQFLQLGHVLKLQKRINEALDAYAHALVLDPQLLHAREELSALGCSERDIEARIAADPTSIIHPEGAVVGPIKFHGDEPTIEIVNRSFCIVYLDTTRIIGWAYLPFDFHHTALVNVYHRGFLVAASLANRTRPEGWTIGPKYNWFDISVERARITEPDLSELIFQRGEDGKLAPFYNKSPRKLTPVKIADLLETEAFDIPRIIRCPALSQLLNFSAKATVQIYFLDYLGRPTDPRGLSVYQPALEDGRMSIDDLRTSLLHSEEFRQRRVRVSDRLGQTACIPFLSLYPEMAYDELPPLRTYDLIPASALSVEDDAEFLRRCEVWIYGQYDEVDQRSQFLEGLQGGLISRLEVLREMILDAASVGRLVRLIDATTLSDGTIDE